MRKICRNTKNAVFWGAGAVKNDYEDKEIMSIDFERKFVETFVKKASGADYYLN